MNSQHLAGFTRTALEETCVIGRSYLSDGSCDDPSVSSMVGEPVVPSRCEKHQELKTRRYLFERTVVGIESVRQLYSLRAVPICPY